MVIGVATDIHYEPLRQPIAPLAMFCRSHDWAFAYTGVKLRGGDVVEAVGFVKRTWEELIPEFPITCWFLDDDFERLYRSEECLGQALGTFAGLAVLVACVGGLALAVFSCEQRTREIGVRRVAVATSRSVVGLRSRDFTRPVLAANAVAWPVAYLAMTRWLEGFAYRTSIDPGTFVASGLAVLAVAWVAVGYQAHRAAGADPVTALRHE